MTTTTPAAFKCDYPNCHCDHGALMACREAGFPGSPHAAAQKSGTTPAAPTTPYCRRSEAMPGQFVCDCEPGECPGFAAPPAAPTTPEALRARCVEIALAGVDGTHPKYAEACRTIAAMIEAEPLAAPAEGQQPAEPGQADGDGVSERAPNDDEVICPPCTHQFRAIPPSVQRLMLAAGFEPPFVAAPAQGVFGLGRVIRDDEWLQLHFVSDVAADAFAATLKITVDVEDMPPLNAATAQEGQQAVGPIARKDGKPLCAGCRGMGAMGRCAGCPRPDGWTADELAPTAPASAPSADLSAALSRERILEIAGHWMVTGENQKRETGYVYRSIGEATNVRADHLVEFASALLDSAASLVRATPPDLAAELRECSTAAIDVLAERRRQIEVEGWTPEHDDEHGDGQMALAAGAYAVVGCTDAAPSEVPAWWPWPGAWWKPSTNRRNLVKAAALLLAEIDRLDRDALRAKGKL